MYTRRIFLSALVYVYFDLSLFAFDRTHQKQKINCKIIHEVSTVTPRYTIGSANVEFLNRMLMKAFVGIVNGTM